MNLGPVIWIAHEGQYGVLGGIRVGFGEASGDPGRYEAVVAIVGSREYVEYEVKR